MNCQEYEVHILGLQARDETATENGFTSYEKLCEHWNNLEIKRKRQQAITENHTEHSELPF